MKRVILPLLFSLCLCSCAEPTPEYDEFFYGFDTYISVKVYEDHHYLFNGFKQKAETFSKECNRFVESDVIGVRQINSLVYDDQWLKVSDDLYDCLKKAVEYTELLKGYFSIYLGALSHSWDVALKDGQVLSEQDVEISMIYGNGTKLEFWEQGQSVRKSNYGEIDLGAIAKGYYLDYVKKCFDVYDMKKYIVDAGSSSILLGEKPTEDGLYTIKIKSVENTYIEAKNTFLSTSSIDNQIYTVEGKQYSHIIDPKTGYPQTLNQTCIVLTDSGTLGDVLSTSMMLMDIDKVKEAEEQFNAKAIIIREGQIIYQNPNIKVVNG